VAPKIFAWLLVSTWLLAACQLPASTPIPGFDATLAFLATNSKPPALEQALEATVTPPASGREQAGATATIGAPAQAAHTAAPPTAALPATLPLGQTRITLEALSNPQNLLFHDLFLFQSASLQPIVNLELIPVDHDDSENTARFLEPQLWMLSPDGQRAGVFFSSLFSDDNLFALHLPEAAGGTVRSVEVTVHLNHAQIQPAPLPPECLANPLYCRGFTFSPDGEYLGFFFGAYQCGYGLRVISTLNGADRYLQPAAGHFLKFLSSGKALVASGDCASGQISQLDLSTGELEILGDEGQDLFWSPNGQALVVLAHSNQGLQTDLWAYDVNRSQVWLRDSGVIEHVVWAPDSNSFFFSKAERVGNSNGGRSYGDARLYRARLNEQPQAVLGQAGYNEYLCAGAWTGCEWRQDWITLRRFPALPTEPVGAVSDACFQRGEGCPAPAELLAYNWRTDELTPWQGSPLAGLQLEITPTPNLSALGPDLERQPIYTAETGDFAFYLGLDGHSLWRVPRRGAAILWVKDGQNFVYLP
jgi:hypothetical protein